MSAVAELHLYKLMLKSKSIVSAPAFPSYILAKVETATQAQNIAHANVQARLFNSNVVKVAMTNIMDSTRASLGIGNGESVGRKKRVRAADYKSEIKPTRPASVKHLEPEKLLTTKEEDKSDHQTHSTSESLHGDPDVTSSEDESVNLAAYEDRLAESENESTRELQVQKSSTKHQKELEHSPFRGLSPSPSRSMSSSPSIIDNPKARKVPTIKPKSTIFLPSLTMGGYISDSDSAISDPSSLPGNATAKSRKNRRGQQERRQIWEKKFGKNANHLKRQGQQHAQNRDQGWDARKGALKVGGDDRGKRGRGRGRGRVVDASTGPSTRTARARATGKGGVGPISSGANSDPVHARRGGNNMHGPSKERSQASSATTAAESTRLHPSWEAAKRQKEARTNVAFQGKKLVF